MSVKACRQELPNKGVKLPVLRVAAYAQNVRRHEFEIWELIHPVNGGKVRMLTTWLSTFGYLLNKVLQLRSLPLQSVNVAGTTFDSTQIGMKVAQNASAHHAVKMRLFATAKMLLRKPASRRLDASAKRMSLTLQ